MCIRDRNRPERERVRRRGNLHDTVNDRELRCGDLYSRFWRGVSGWNDNGQLLDGVALHVFVHGDGDGHDGTSRHVSGRDVDPVSYTHLDVYKRQVLERVKAEFPL